MEKIISSVGRDGENRASDVKVVQQLLNQHAFAENPVPLNVNGLVDPEMVSRIEVFQQGVVKMARPDGRVDPDGKTFSFLCRTLPESKAAGSYQMSDKGMDLLRSIEELRLQPYDDQTGKEISAWVTGATIGYGHLISRNEWDTYKNGLDIMEAKALFEQDLLPYVQTVNTEVTSGISQNQFDALVILTFNIGRNAFKSSSVLKMINDPSANTGYTNLEAAWKAWNKSQGKKMQGLVNRRNAEWDIYSMNIYKKW